MVGVVDRACGVDAVLAADRTGQATLAEHRPHVEVVLVEEVRGEFPSLTAEIRSERCNHCSVAPCVSACPTGASYVNELGYRESLLELEAKRSLDFRYLPAISRPTAEANANWEGYTGFIHQVVLDNYLKNHPEPEEIEYYLCGPPMMLSAVMSMLDELGVPDENIAFDDFGS